MVVRGEALSAAACWHAAPRIDVVGLKERREWRGEEGITRATPKPAWQERAYRAAGGVASLCRGTRATMGQRAMKMEGDGIAAPK